MNEEDRAELIRLAQENIELQRLLARHKEYKERIRMIRKQGFLTAIEQQELQDLKVKKLHGKEKMYRLMDSLKQPRVHVAKDPVIQKASGRSADRRMVRRMKSSMRREDSQRRSRTLHSTPEFQPSA